MVRYHGVGGALTPCRAQTSPSLRPTIVLQNRNCPSFDGPWKPCGTGPATATKAGHSTPETGARAQEESNLIPLTLAQALSPAQERPRHLLASPHSKGYGRGEYKQYRVLREGVEQQSWANNERCWRTAMRLYRKENFYTSCRTKSKLCVLFSLFFYLSHTKDKMSHTSVYMLDHNHKHVWIKSDLWLVRLCIHWTNRESNLW